MGDMGWRSMERFSGCGHAISGWSRYEEFHSYDFLWFICVSFLRKPAFYSNPRRLEVLVWSVRWYLRPLAWFKRASKPTDRTLKALAKAADFGTAE